MEVKVSQAYRMAQSRSMAFKGMESGVRSVHVARHEGIVPRRGIVPVGTPSPHRERLMLTHEDFPRSWQGRADDVSTISPSGRAAGRSYDLHDEERRVMVGMIAPRVRGSRP
jgi:hypothetical protein